MSISKLQLDRMLLAAITILLLNIWPLCFVFSLTPSQFMVMYSWLHVDGDAGVPVVSSSWQTWASMVPVFLLNILTGFLSSEGDGLGPWWVEANLTEVCIHWLITQAYLLLTFQFSNVILCSEKTDWERPSSKNVINTLLLLIFNQDACLGPLKWETLIIFQESLSCRYLKKCFPFIISVWRIHRVNLSKPL